MLQQRESPPSTQLVPMRWPIQWEDPSALALLKDSGINCLLIARDSGYDGIVVRAIQDGIIVMDATEPPSGIHIVKGLWPGVKLTESGKVDQVSAGPTGDPWVDSNGWRVRLAATQHPGQAIWVDAAPSESRLRAESYVMALADAAAYGGSWITTLDDSFADAVKAQKTDALAKWKRLTAATRFFANRAAAWSGYVPEALLGIVSDFSGPNQTFSGELLNLVARTNQQYRIVLKENVSEASFRGLKAAIYVDADPPSPILRERLSEFVQAGGTLTSGPAWGAAPEQSRVLVAKKPFSDPYAVAQESMVMISHRHDLLRFWNGGAIGSFLTMAPDRSRALLQLLFYSSNGPGATSVRVAGRYKVAMLSTMDQPVPHSVEIESQKDAVELHLPPVSQFAAIELEV